MTNQEKFDIISDELRKIYKTDEGIMNYIKIPQKTLDNKTPRELIRRGDLDKIIPNLKITSNK